MIYVFVSYSYSGGFDSPEKWFKRTEGYAGLLECLGKENTVINIKQINYKGECNHNGVQYRFVNYYKEDSYFSAKINRYIRDLNPDIVFVQGLHHPLKLIHLSLGLNKKTKIIVQHHAEKPFTGVKKYIQRVACSCADAYLFASRAMGEDWVRKGNLLSARKIHEVMEVSSLFYPVEQSFARLRTGSSGNPVFLWVGRLNANKDPLNVVKAFLKFVGLQPSARLYMIFQTDELLTEITMLLEGHAHENSIVLTGKILHEELLYWFNSSDFIISGSYYEGSGTAICEAISCGCIPVVTDICSFRMITDNGRCGILYKAGNEVALLSALIETKQIDIEEKRRNCLDYFKSTLSFEAIASRVQGIAGSL